MRRSNTIAVIFVLGSAIALGSAYADIIEVTSKIIEISASSIDKNIKVYHLDPQTGKTEEIKVEVGDNTLFGEIGSLDNLKVGDEIVIEADFDAFNHVWKAQSIKPYKPT